MTLTRETRNRPTPGPVRFRPPLRAIWEATRDGHRPLFVLAIAMFVLSGVLVVLSLVDPRTLHGSVVWMKPLKFALSFTLYAAAASWLMSALPTTRRIRKVTGVAGWFIVIASAFEQGIITVQAARAVDSHFNNDSTIDTFLFVFMGVQIGILYGATSLLALAVIVLRRDPNPVATGIKAGLLVALFGMAIGGIMLALFSHIVGTAAPDGQIPVLGWSTANGDLRVSHFIGLHALQLLPIAGGFITALGAGRWSLLTQIRLTRLAGATLAGIVLVLLIQALRAQPLLRPDLLTWITVAIVAAATAAGAWAILRTNSDHPTPTSPVPLLQTGTSFTSRLSRLLAGTKQRPPKWSPS